MDQLFSIQSLLLLFLFVYFYFLTSQTKAKPAARNGFRIYPLLGALPDLLKNRNRFLDWTTHVLSECPTNTAVFYWPGKVHEVLTANPENVEHMLKTNFDNYPKGQTFISLLEDFLGRGIFNCDGELWKIQRKTASYEFNTKSLRNFIMETVTVEIQTRLIPTLSEVASSQTKQVLDMQDILERFAFDNICKLAFNVDPGCLGGDETAGAEFMRAFEDAATLSSDRFLCTFPFWKIKKLFNVGTERRMRESILTVHKFADEIIRSRMESNPGKGEEIQDLLSRFIGTQESSSSAEPGHKFLRDIIISFILAGRDTTSSALTWFFWILSSRPDVKQKILDELETIRARNGKGIGETFSFEELREMHYLNAALSETMRVYPPVPIDTKACLKDDILPDGTVVKKNWLVSYHTYAMGRMERVWGKDCQEFKPQRWIESGVFRAESPFRFPVFHAGPRMCLGKDLAYIQMKSIAATLIERFEFHVENNDTCPSHILSLTLRMERGLPVLVKERGF